MKKRETILQQNMERYFKQGYVLYAYSDGQASFAKVSNSGRILVELEKKLGTVEVVIVTGARRQRASEGTKNAIMYKPKLVK